MSLKDRRMNICRSNIIQSLCDAFNVFNDLPCLWCNDDELCYSQVYQHCMQLGCTLFNEEYVVEGDMIGMFMSNCVEWYECDFTCALYGIVMAPLPTTLNVDRLVYLVNKCELRGVFYDELTWPILKQAMPQCPTLRWTMSKGEFRRLRSVPTQHVRPVTKRCDSELFTLIFTSGSTGMPKGAIISYECWNTRLNGKSLSTDRAISWMSFQPATHMMDRKGVWFTILNGGVVGFSTVDRVHADMQLFHPTSVTASPRFWNSLYQQHLDMLNSGQHTEAEALKLTRQKLGQKMMIIVNAGAKISANVIEFLRKCFDGVRIMDAYGSTEMDHISTNGASYKDQVSMRLLDVPGYSSSDQPYPRGEIVIRSPSAFSGYYKDEEATNAAFVRISDKLWYRTGDIAELREPGRYTIVDRRSNILKLPSGEFVAPELLETYYCGRSELISQLYIHAESSYPFVLAVVVPSVTAFAKYNIGGLAQVMLRELTRIAMEANDTKSHPIQPWEIPRAVIIARQAFTIDNGCLTGPDKMCRTGIKREYKDELANEFEKLVSVPNANSMMFKEDSNIKDVIASVMPGVRVLLDSSFALRQLGGDSLSMTRLSTTIDRVYGVKVTVNELLQDTCNATTLDQLIKRRRIDGSDGRVDWNEVASAEQELVRFLQSEAQFTPEFPTVHVTDADQRRFNTPTHILVTGATGFIGSHLVSHLLHTMPSATVWCLARRTDEMCAFDRVVSVLKERQHLTSADLKRIRGVDGDLDRPQFGSNEYDTLNDMIDVIFHCGAYVNHVQPYSSHRAANVDGTASLLRMCAHKAHTKCMHFVSSVGALTFDMKDAESGKILETTALGTLGLSLLDGYSQSKWVSERLCDEARDLGVPCVIHRAAFVCGHSKSGFSNRSDMVSRMIISMAELGCAPLMRQDFRLDLTPVDWVCGAMCEVAFKHHSPARRYHVVAPNNDIEMPLVVSAMRNCGVVLRDVQHTEFVDTVLKKQPMTAFAPLVHRFRNSPRQRAFLMDKRNTHGMVLDDCQVTGSTLEAYVRFILNMDSTTTTRPRL